MKRYKVTLTKEEREQLETLMRKGKSNARVLTRARILLKADQAEHGPGWTDEKIKEATDASIATIERTRKRFVLESLDASVYDRRHLGRPKYVMDGAVEAHVIALSCGKPPQGYAAWTLQLLAQRMVALSYATQISRETVRRTLKKMNSSHT